MKATKPMNTAAIMILEQLNQKIAKLETRTNQDYDEKELEQFIFDSWLIELEFAKYNKDILESWIIDQEFPV